MESEIKIGFFRGGEAKGVITVNRSSLHPDITDIDPEELFNWVVDVGSIFKDAYTGSPGWKWIDEIKDVGNLVKDVFKQKNKGKKTRDRSILLGPGGWPLGGPALDEAIVTFRAWSEDDLTESFGRVDPLGKIIDLGEKRYDDNNGNHVYEHSFRIPLRHTPPGPYLFSFGSGDEGWRYSVGIASLLTLGITQSRHSGFLVQSTLGRQGNFEVVVPRAEGGLSYFWRDNDPDGTGWHRVDFATDIGQVDSVSLIQSNLGPPGVGNLELVARIGDRLKHLWHPLDSPPDSWWSSEFFGSGVSGNPALLQGTFGIQGHFELVIPRIQGGMSYYWRDNDPGAGFRWHGPFDFATDVGQVDSVSLIQSNFGSPGVGELEVVARIGNGLAHFKQVKDTPPYEWIGPQFFAEGVSGTPSLIQGWHGNVGNYELVVPRPGGGLAHYWRNNDAGQNMTWNGPLNFAEQLGQVDEVSLIQSNYGTTGLGNLEVVARIGNRLAHIWRTDVAPYTWSDPFYFEAPQSRVVVMVQPYPTPLSYTTVTVFAVDETTRRPI
ncbi:MAG: hypothetical protein AB2401_04755, partial [Bacillus sp. (in: firmicutes)]